MDQNHNNHPLRHGANVPPDLPDQLPPPLPESAANSTSSRASGEAANRSIHMDKIVHNFDQLKQDPKGWAQALPLWRKVLLGAGAAWLAVWLLLSVVGSFGGVPSAVEQEAIARWAERWYVKKPNYEITNSYERKRDGETYHYQEFSLTLSTGRVLNHGVIYHQRGDRWYWEYFNPTARR